MHKRLVLPRHFSGYISAFLYSALSGFSFLNNKLCLLNSSLMQTLFWRFFIAFIFVVLLALFGVIRLSFAGKPYRHLFVACICYVLLIFFQTFGLVYASTIVGGILFAVVPALSRLIAGRVLGEKSTPLQNFFAALSIASVMVMLGIGSGGALKTINPAGFVLFMLAGIFGATGNVYMRLVRVDYSPVEISFVSIAIGFVAFTLLSGATERFAGYLDVIKNVDFLMPVFYISIVCTFMTSALISNALRYLPALTATIWGNLTTVISVAAGAVLLGEPLYPYQIICMVFIVTGVLGISYFTEFSPGGGGQR
jgi:drug/metabolite transporter (DMT)-like permease